MWKTKAIGRLVGSQSLTVLITKKLQHTHFRLIL